MPFEIGECGGESCAALKEMYDGFNRPAVSQGLPPANKEDRDRWVEGLLAGAWNVVARTGAFIIGHAALIPNPERGDAEYVIFVSDVYRNRGVGTELTFFAMNHARELELKRVWLTVESFNFRAVKLYKKAGFQFVDAGERERTMVLEL